jgi:hypothetical protein
MHWIECAFCLALASAGKSSAARMAMMAITTSSSIRVNPRHGNDRTGRGRGIGHSVAACLVRKGGRDGDKQSLLFPGRAKKGLALHESSGTTSILVNCNQHGTSLTALSSPALKYRVETFWSGAACHQICKRFASRGDIASLCHQALEAAPGGLLGFLAPSPRNGGPLGRRAYSFGGCFRGGVGPY